MTSWTSSPSPSAPSSAALTDGPGGKADRRAQQGGEQVEHARWRGIELGRDRAADAWIAPGGCSIPPPNRTCGFHRIRLSTGWVYPRDSRCSTFIVGCLHPFSGVIRVVPIHRLPSFARWPAFPVSDYYEGSVPHPALAAGWPPPLPESWTRFPSSRRLRLHSALGSAFTLGTARCRARHRGTAGDTECGAPVHWWTFPAVDRVSDDSALALPWTGSQPFDASDSSFPRNHSGTLASGAQRGRVAVASLSGRLQTRFCLWPPCLLP